MATTITVTSTNKGDPSPIKLNLWHDDWQAGEGGLADLTNWADGGGGKRCTTSATVDDAERKAGPDLDAWRDEDFGHRNYTIA